MSLSKLIQEKLKELEEMSTTGAGEAYDTPGAFSASGDEDENDNAENSGYKKVTESKFKKIAKSTFLKEASYKEYKKDDTLSSKQKVNKSIKEVASRLYKIERIISQNIKLKTEDNIDNKQYWKSTRKTLYKISERMMRIGEKLRKF